MTAPVDPTGPRPDDDAPAPEDRVEQVAVRKHSLAARWMHWIHFPVLMVMLWSGLRIYNASDTHAIEVLGLRFDFFPQGVYDAVVADRRLAKGLAFHLTFGWLFVANGALFTAYVARRGRWRELVPTLDGLRTVPATIAHDLGLRKQAPPHGKYNPAQQLAYTAVLVMGAVMVASGFAIYKPTQLSELTWLLGGYETARLVHFTTALLMVAFFLVHVVQVVRAGWRGFSAMVSGYELKDRPGSTAASSDEEAP